MTEARIAQDAIEVGFDADTSVRIAQEAIEVGLDANTSVRVAQEAVETAFSASTQVRVAQALVEVAMERIVVYSGGGGGSSAVGGGGVKSVATVKSGGGGGFITVSGGASLTLPERESSLVGLRIPDDHMALFPWFESQRLLMFDTAPELAVPVATCGWHGTNFDPNRGAYAVVREDGPLGDLVGERLRLTYFPEPSLARSVVVYAITLGQPMEDISLSRRAFMGLAPLAAGRVSVVVDVLV